MDKLWMSLEVRAKRREAEAVYSFELAYPDLELLPPFEAGAHLEVRVGESLIRHYSLCNSPDERDRYVIGVHKASSSRGGSVAMAALNVGDVIQVSAPRNQFQLDPQARHCVLIAGGIGVTPILAMARQLHLQGRSFELHYLARSWRTAGFVQDIERSRFAHHASFHFEDELAGRPDLQRIVGQPRDGSHLYVCGPAVLMDGAFDVALAQGWSATHLHREHFKAVLPPTDAVQDEQSFKVVTRSTGETFEVPAGISVLDVLDAAGVFVPSSCREGLCGTCVTGVLEGTPDHRDVCLSAQERDSNTVFMPCCSRSKSPVLVLDL